MGLKNRDVIDRFMARRSGRTSGNRVVSLGDTLLSYYHYFMAGWDGDSIIVNRRPYPSVTSLGHHHAMISGLRHADMRPVQRVDLSRYRDMWLRRVDPEDRADPVRWSRNGKHPPTDLPLSKTILKKLKKEFDCRAQNEYDILRLDSRYLLFGEKHLLHCLNLETSRMDFYVYWDGTEWVRPSWRRKGGFNNCRDFEIHIRRRLSSLATARRVEALIDRMKENPDLAKATTLLHWIAHLCPVGLTFRGSLGTYHAEAGRLLMGHKRIPTRTGKFAHSTLAFYRHAMDIYKAIPPSARVLMDIIPDSKINEMGAEFFSDIIKDMGGGATSPA